MLATGSKWISDLPADAAPGTWALHSIRVRLNAVRHDLPLAAAKADRDPEYVHQLRVATRRATAVLDVYHELLPPRKTRRLRKVLRAVRRAAGRARDLDVLLLRHGQKQKGKPAKKFLGLIHSRRRAAQHELVGLCRVLRSEGSLKQRFRSYSDHVRQRIETTTGPAAGFPAWAAQQLQKLLHQFLLAMPGATPSPADLHELRIRGKQLRYAMELLSAAFSADFRESLYPRLEDLIEQLGTLHDHAVAIEYFRRWRQSASRKSLRRHLQQLIDSELQSHQELLKAFLHTSNAESFRALAAEFQAFF